VPTVDTPLPLLNYLGALAAPATTGDALRFLLEPERAQGRSGRSIDLASSASRAAIAIGPEGGFAPEELEAFDLSTFARLGLGPRVLRTETAAIAAIVVLQARFGDMSVLSDDSSRTADS